MTQRRSSSPGPLLVAVPAVLALALLVPLAPSAVAVDSPADDAHAGAAAVTATLPDTARAPVRLRDRLLPAGELPGIVRGARWRTGTTGPGEPARLAGACHRVPLHSVGAFRVLSRAYAASPAGRDGPTARASHVVARFADRVTARRAYAVLRAWQVRCTDVLTEPGARVGPLVDVTLPAAQGHWYTVEAVTGHAGSQAQRHDATGVVRHGRRVAVLRLTMSGADPEPRREPVRAALRAAAARLG